ncbi:MAG TPA: helix-turn-helix transcriptional regulator [Clostridiales bacterium]|nr:helix-turn-helix transcriptional regulator [Clostridiales bacterium]
MKKAIRTVEKKRLNTRFQEYGMAQLNQLKKTSGQKERNSRMIVQEVKSYINNHLQEELSVDFLAKRVYVSTAYLCHVFKKEENKTLVEYITQARLFYAAELLKDSNNSVSCVAASVGYNNYCYFTKVFKKIYGMSPSQYQQKCSLRIGK